MLEESQKSEVDTEEKYEESCEKSELREKSKEKRENSVLGEIPPMTSDSLSYSNLNPVLSSCAIVPLQECDYTPEEIPKEEVEEI